MKNIQAKERDDRMCVLSGLAFPEAAHIFPYSTTERGNFANLNRLLRLFWGPEQAAGWSKSFEDKNLTESALNLISLSPTLHGWFDSAKIALKPLRVEENGAVVVQFHSLKESKLKPRTFLEKPLDNLSFGDILLKAGLEDNRDWGGMSAHRKSGIRLETGQTFVLGAKNPDRAPSFELLKLSWNLLQVAAICGAAEPEELTGEEEDDDYFGTGWQVWGEDGYEQEEHWAEDQGTGEGADETGPKTKHPY